MKITIPMHAALVLFPAAHDLASLPRKKKKKMKKEFNKVFQKHISEWLEKHKLNNENL